MGLCSVLRHVNPSEDGNRNGNAWACSGRVDGLDVRMVGRDVASPKRKAHTVTSWRTDVLACFFESDLD